LIFGGMVLIPLGIKKRGEGGAIMKVRLYLHVLPYQDNPFSGTSFYIKQ